MAEENTKEELKEAKEEIKEIKEEIKKNRLAELHKGVQTFGKAFKDNFITLIISALGLLVALSWNNFWSFWVATLATEQTLPYKFYIAIGTTVLAVILTYILTRFKSETKP
jgi:polyferredoxin